MNSEQTRKGFEAWAKVNRSDLDLRYMYDADGHFHGDCYIWEDAQQAFNIWQNAIKNTQQDTDSWEANAQYMLERCPYTVWQRLGGGPVDLKATLVVTFLGMQNWRRTHSE